MAIVKDQDQYHALLPLLEQWITTRGQLTRGVVQGVKVPTKRRTLSPRLKICQAILALAVERWQALSNEEQQTWDDNCPVWAQSGYHYFMWFDMVQDYGGGPWKTEYSEVHGHGYIVPEAAPEGVVSIAYTGATILGSTSILLKGEKTQRQIEEAKRPILLVHGWYKDPFDPYLSWKAMTLALTGKDPTASNDYEIVYSPGHPADPSYALRKCEGYGRTLYISNYTRDYSQGISGDLREYAHELQDDVALACSDADYDDLDVVAHSFGGLIARAYIEAEDLSDPPFDTAYQGNVRKLIMMGTPNQGSYLANLWPDFAGWTCLQQAEHGSDFLSELNTGTTGVAKGVEYSCIAGNYYKCRKFPRFWAALLLCVLGFDTENDGAVSVLETKLAFQAGEPEIPASRWYIIDVDHSHLRGESDQDVYTANIITTILEADVGPTETDILSRSLALINATAVSALYYKYIMAANITVKFQDLPEGTLSSWDPNDNAILISLDLEENTRKIVGSHIVYAAEKCRWLAEHSISKEYHAYLNQANFWDEVKGASEDEYLDSVADFIAPGKASAMTHLRELDEYSELPEYSGISEALNAAFCMLEDVSDTFADSAAVQRLGILFDYNADIKALYDYLWLEEDDPFAHYDRSTRTGAIDADWAEDDAEATAAALAYLTERALLFNPPNIHQEYSAFMQMALVWNTIKGELEHEFCDLVASKMQLSEPEAKAWIYFRFEYADLPDEYIGLPEAPTGDLHVDFIYVGQGDGIVITTPSGQRIIIDGGEGQNDFLSYFGRTMAPWNRDIAAVILSHADADHIQGQIPILDRYNVSIAFDSGYPDETDSYLFWLNLIEEKSITYHETRDGITIDTGDGVVLTCLHPGPVLMEWSPNPVNQNSLVFRLTYGDVSFLFTGDIEEQAEGQLLTRHPDLESTILKVAHHGSDTSSTPEFLASVKPQMAIISCGIDNPHGHPAEAVVERLEAYVGADHLYRTDIDGTIMIKTDGTRVYVTTRPYDGD